MRLSAFFFLQGFAVFLAEMIWVKLGVIFLGGTYRVASVVLSAFFAGVAAGNFWWGKKAAAKFPLVPLVVCLAAGWPLSYYAFQTRFSGPWPVFLGLFPVCFASGGFFPMAALRVAPAALLRLYAVNGAGAAAGIICALFFLLPALGFGAVFFIAASISTAALFLWPRNPDIENARLRARPAPEAALSAGAKKPERLSWKTHAAGIVSGFLTLLMEVVWVRQIAAGTDNSVCAFGSATLMVLLFIFIAAYCVSRFPPKWRSSDALAAAAFLSGAGIVISSHVYIRLTGGLATHVVDHSTGFLESLGFGIRFLPLAGVLPAFIFPVLIRSLTEGSETHPNSAGGLFALNGAGCALGALGGALLPPALGLWGMASAAALGYAGLALLFASGWRGKTIAAAGTGVILIFLPLKFPIITADPLAAGFDGPGEVLWKKEGGYGAVSVVRFGGQRTLWLNSSYVLGGSRAVADDRRLGLFPALFRPEAKRAALIGVATGITASGLLDSPLERVTLIELVPEVKEAAEKFFGEANRRSLSDPRAEVVIADGRRFISLPGGKFDLIVSDLFVPWHENTSFLYTLEHFRNVKGRLSTGGLFFLWLPAYELTEEEFWIVARTFGEVFPEASLWQNGFSPAAPVLGLAGGKIDWAVIDSASASRKGKAGADYVEKHRAGIYSRFISTLDPQSMENRGVKANTQNLPILEYLSSRPARPLLTGKRYLGFLSRTMRPHPSFSDSAAGYQKAGWHMAHSVYELRRGNRGEAYRNFDLYKSLMPEALRQP